MKQQIPLWQALVILVVVLVVVIGGGIIYMRSREQRIRAETEVIPETVVGQPAPGEAGEGAPPGEMPEAGPEGAQ